MIVVFEDHRGYVAVHHGWDGSIEGRTALTAVAGLYDLLASARDDGTSHLLATASGMPATAADIEQALEEIEEYAQAKGLDLSQREEPRRCGSVGA
ncbi:hypothetical protein ABZ930_27310 [Streptomyces sp. NPDC046716]|uniref:hypothetical protein n=1 Tax=Streptomyces sp. NPDC046716 TaxID=3157093 RepID=UPI0033D195B9